MATSTRTDPLEGYTLPSGEPISRAWAELALANGYPPTRWFELYGSEWKLSTPGMALAAYTDRAGLSPTALELADRLARICEAARGWIEPRG